MYTVTTSFRIKYPCVSIISGTFTSQGFSSIKTDFSLFLVFTLKHCNTLNALLDIINRQVE